MKALKTITAVTLAAPLLASSGCGTPGSGRNALAGTATASSSREYSAPNSSGTAQTMRADGGPVVDPSNPFFQSLGTNGRTCASCHRADEGMTITPAGVQKIFDETDGTDPIFRTNDGSNSPLADVSTVEARRSAYSMLLDRGVIRVGMPVPAGAEFELVSVSDPYGYANAADLSLFRRPLPATNLRFLSAVMWDGRETFRDPSQPSGFAPLEFDLADQANGATLGHAQGTTPLTQAQKDAIVAYESALYTAQTFDDAAGNLSAAQADGGPGPLSVEPFHFGINDVLGGDPSGASFTPVVMTLFDAWQAHAAPTVGRNAARRAVARGQAIFNGRTFDITGVGGLNDDLGIPVLHGTCTTCHDTPNAGDHSVPLPIDIGTTDPHPPVLDVTGLPVYTFRDPATGQTRSLTDPGRALITGKWKDLGRLKGPTLRALATRAPYFHNGSAATIGDVVDFYDTRFSIHLTAQEKSDLIAFLRTL